MRGTELALPAVLALLVSAQSVVASTGSDLQDHAKQVPEESLRAALEDALAPKYRDGVFEDQESAIEAISSQDPELATRVLESARQDILARLIKRQDSSNATAVTITTNVAVVSAETGTVAVVTTPTQGTSETTSVPTTSFSTIYATAVVAQSESSLLVPGVTSTTTGANGVTSVISTPAQLITSASVTAALPVTTTNAQGSPITSTTNVPAVVVPSTSSAGQVVHSSTSNAAGGAGAVAGSTSTGTSTGASTGTPNGHSTTTSATSGSTTAKPSGSMLTTTDAYGDTVVLSGASLGAVISTTDAKGRAVVITVTPGAGVASGVVFQTTTGPDGQPSTITSFAAVAGPTQSTMATSPSQAPSESAMPTLAPSIAAPVKQNLEHMLVLLVAGLVAAFFL